MRIFTGKRAVVIGAVIGLSLGAGGLAFAFFTSSGNGTGQGSTGSPSNWSVTAGAVANGPIYPGQGSETITFTIKNVGSGNQALTGPGTATVVGDSSVPPNIEQSGTPLSGCLVSWYAASVTTAPSTASLAPNATTTAVVTVTMNDEPVNQNVCMGAKPDINLSVS